MDAESFAELNSRAVAAWFPETPFGIFIHWGAYSVPAWAEPIGALGTIDDTTWFRHNPYAEWYFNTIRIQGSPAHLHHQQTWGGRPYDDFLDIWQAERFDGAEWLDLFARAGAGYVVPTTKHHDGITLWAAPEVGDRHTVARGPRRDLVAELAQATRAAGLRFGVYYSGGLDWHLRDLGVHRDAPSVHDTLRPKDAEYAALAAAHCTDLVDRFQPDILWNDISWPDGGYHFDAGGLGTLFNHYYAVVPDGVVNDRWGGTHFDYRTSEYEAGRELEAASHWENCRGIGYSFGYNRVEGPEVYLTGLQVARQLADVVSRGGHFLLNVGPQADGSLPTLQRQCLEDVAAWMQQTDSVVLRAKPWPQADLDTPAGVWARAVRVDGRDALVVDSDGATGRVRLTLDGRTIETDLKPDAGPQFIDVD